MQPPPQDAPHGFEQSMGQIVDAEQAAFSRRTRGEAAVEAVVAFVGTLPFVLIHVAVLAGWVAVNVRVFPRLPVFDPYPFAFLGTLLCFESVVLTALVLMTQQRMGMMSDRRDHLDLQVNLLTEREATQILQLLHRVAERLDVPLHGAEEARELAKPSSIAAMVGALHEALPGDRLR